MTTSTLIEINSNADFVAAFPGAMIGSQNGLWNYDTGGSTSSGSTGPGGNNMLAFMHTETSGASDADTAGGNGIAAFADLPDQAARTLHLRVCIQGDFGDGTEGLRVQQRAAAGDPWTEAGFIYGWTYSDYTAGQPVTDENGTNLTIAADGGWIDFEVAVADDATEVRLLPVYIFQGGIFRHDIALRSYQWEWPGTTPPPLPDAVVLTGQVLAAEATISRADLNVGVLPNISVGTWRAAEAMRLTAKGRRYALEITHPALTDTLRVVRNTQDIEIEGNTFQRLTFTLMLPNDEENEIGEFLLEIGNVGEALTQWIEASDGGLGSTVRIMEVMDVANQGWQVTWETTQSAGSIVSMSNALVQITLIDDPLGGMPAVRWRHDRERSPGLH